MKQPVFFVCIPFCVSLSLPCFPVKLTDGVHAGFLKHFEVQYVNMLNESILEAALNIGELSKRLVDRSVAQYPSPSVGPPLDATTN